MLQKTSRYVIGSFKCIHEPVGLKAFCCPLRGENLMSTVNGGLAIRLIGCSLGPANIRGPEFLMQTNYFLAQLVKLVYQLSDFTAEMHQI